ncbi:MAG: hypothetical protein Fur005_09840 [Roseiflexaceae bacterium]
MMAVVSGLLALVVLASTASAQTTWEPRKVKATLKGSGATFPNPLYQTWIAVYKNVNPTVTISYQSVGSGQGQTDFIRYLTDFGGTDSILSDARIKAEAPDTLHIPTVIGAVVPTYNLGGVSQQLRFSPATLSGIYTWHDQALE